MVQRPIIISDGAELIRTRATIGPVGRCIYCGRVDVPLTNEHVVPKGLGGRLELLKSSCTACQRKIHPVETSLMTGPFQSIRRANELRGSKGKLGRPISIKLVKGRIREIPVSDFPVHVPVPIFFHGLPHLLLDQPKDSWILCDWRTKFLDEDSTKNRKLQNLGLQFSDIVEFPDPHFFVRFLAKVAHSYACAMHHNGVIPAFQPYLHKLARGDTPLLGGALIGNDLNQPFESTNVGHATQLMLVNIDRGLFKGRKYILCNIRLFGSYTSWTYTAIAGRLLD